jgi:O-Antigen ligase
MAPDRRDASVLMLGVHFLTGMLLVVGQLLPGGTQQVANGESLPQALLWLLVGALLATDRVLTRMVSSNSHNLSGRNESAARFDRWLILLGVGLLVWVCLSTFNVYGHGNFRFAVNAGWQWIASAVSIVVLSRMMASPRVQQGIQWLMIALAWLAAMHGFYQVFVSLPADRERFRLDPQAVIRESGTDAPPGSSTFLLFEQRLQDDSPTGPFALTNSLAGFLVPWILVLLAQVVRSDTGNRDSGWQRMLGLLVMACLGVCLIWTKSRTGWIALGVGCVALFLSDPKIGQAVWRAWHGIWFGSLPGEQAEKDSDLATRLGRRFHWRVPPNVIGYMMPVIFLVGTFAAILVFGLRAWDPKLFSEAGRSLAFRNEYWKTTLRMVADYPLFGVGPGNFQSHYATYKPVMESETIADPHNFLLETLATAGWPALLLLIAMFVWFTRPMVASDLMNRIDVEPSTVHETTSSARSWLWGLLVGAVTGALAVWLGRGALGPMPDYVPYACAIPLAVIAFGVRFGESLRANSVSVTADRSSAGYIPALLGLGIHLLASGGWMTPGIGNTIAVLVAGLWVSGRRHSPSLEIETTGSEEIATEPLFSVRSSWSNFGLLLAGWMLVAAFYLSAWLPRQRSLQVEGARMESGQIDEKLAIAMVLADPWNPTGYRWLADVRLGQVARDSMNRTSNVATSLSKYQETAREYLARDRGNWETWVQLGHWELAISPSNPEHVGKALEYYREGSKRAPGDIGLLVQAAMAAWLKGDSAAQQEFLLRAEKIDANVEHLDRKLAKAIVYWPASVGPPSTRVAPSLWQGARDTRDLPLDWVRAEPVFRFLRSQKTQNSSGTQR